MSKKKIIKFGKNGCAPCDNVDNYLNSKNIPYTKIDIANLEDDFTLEMIDKFEIGMSIPKTFLVEGDTTLAVKNGFNPKALDDLIEKFRSE